MNKDHYSITDFIQDYGYDGLVSTVTISTLNRFVIHDEFLNESDNLSLANQAASFINTMFLSIQKDLLDGKKYKSVYEFYNDYIKQIITTIPNKEDHTKEYMNAPYSAEQYLDLVVSAITNYTYDDELSSSVKADVTKKIFILFKNGYFLNPNLPDNYSLTIKGIPCKKISTAVLFTSRDLNCVTDEQIEKFNKLIF